ncbi:hypothetical protein SLE2022_320410 [Rubroshorea leprosula]
MFKPFWSIIKCSPGLLILQSFDILTTHLNEPISHSNVFCNHQNHRYNRKKISGLGKEIASGTVMRRMNRMVQPGQSYAQAVVRKGNWVEKNQAQGGISEEKKTFVTNEERNETKMGKIDETEEVRSCEKDNGQDRIERHIGEQSQEIIIEFSPTEQEIHWLEGGMVAVMKSLMSLTSIQERMDVDGGLITLTPLGGRAVLLIERVNGYLCEYMEQNKELIETWFESISPWAVATSHRSQLVWVRISGIPLKAWSDRCFTMIGGTVGEVVMVHEDTKCKSVLCEGRVILLVPETQKISKVLKLKVDGQLYEVQIVEEEWRSNPDWWLSESDRRSPTTASSEYSSKSSDCEDHEFINDEICGDDEETTDLELLQEEAILNSKSDPVEGESLGNYGYQKEIGLENVNGLGRVGRKFC